MAGDGVGLDGQPQRVQPEVERRLPHRLVPLHRRRAPDVVDEHVESALLGVDALDQRGGPRRVRGGRPARRSPARRPPRRARRSPRSSPAAPSPTVPTRSSVPCSRRLRRPRRAARRSPVRHRAWRRRPARPCLPVTAPCSSSNVRVTGVQFFASDDRRVGRVTRQVKLDSYADAGVLVAVELVNALAVEHARGRASVATRAVAGDRRASSPSTHRRGPVSTIVTCPASSPSPAGCGRLRRARTAVTSMPRRRRSTRCSPITRPTRTWPRTPGGGGCTTTRSTPTSCRCARRSAPRPWPG